MERFPASFFPLTAHQWSVSVDCEIVLEYDDEKDAIAVMEAISPDNAPYASAERDGRGVTIRSRSDTCPQMLHTLEDLLACLKVAEEAVRASKLIRA